MVVIEHGVDEVALNVRRAARTKVLVVRWNNATQVVIAQVVWHGALSGWMAGVIAVGAEVVVEGELVAKSWLVFVMIPGTREPVDLAHGG